MLNFTNFSEQDDQKKVNKRKHKEKERKKKQKKNYR